MQVVETYWQKPVTVRLQNGLEHTFLCVEDSLDFLEHEWPMKNGKHQARAIDECRAALNRITSNEVARETFIAACIEAGMTPVFVFGRLNAERELVSRFQ